MDPNHIHLASRLLKECRTANRQVAALPAEMTPQSLADAYRIQGALVTLLSKQVAGWKVGLTSAEAQAANNTNRPIAGRLFEDTVYQSPAVLMGGNFSMRAVEAEVVFEFHKPFSSLHGPYTRAQLISGIARIFPAIEVCDSRFFDCDAIGLPNIVADNSNHGALVLGTGISEFNHIDLSHTAVSLTVNGDDSILGNTNSVLGDPLNSILWLVNDQSGPPRKIEAGQIVASGSCTGITTVNVTDRVVADFDSLGKVVLTFSQCPAPSNQ